MFIHHGRIVPQRIQVSFHCTFNSEMLFLCLANKHLVGKGDGSFLTKNGGSEVSAWTRQGITTRTVPKDTVLEARGKFGSASRTLRLRANSLQHLS